MQSLMHLSYRNSMRAGSSHYPIIMPWCACASEVKVCVCVQTATAAQ